LKHIPYPVNPLSTLFQAFDKDIKEEGAENKKEKRREKKREKKKRGRGEKGNKLAQ